MIFITNADGIEISFYSDGFYLFYVILGTIYDVNDGLLQYEFRIMN